MIEPGDVGGIQEREGQVLKSHMGRCSSPVMPAQGDALRHCVSYFKT